MTDDQKTREGYIPVNAAIAGETLAKTADVPFTRHTELATRAVAPAVPKMDVPGYEVLARILGHAYDQSARGKGKERHGNGLPFDKQPIMEIARMGGLGGHVYQVMKKAQEAGTMHAAGYHDAAIKEFYGVIVYAAAAVKLIEEQRK